MPRGLGGVTMWHESKDEAVIHELLPVLGGFVADFDVAGLADEVIGVDERGRYGLVVTGGEFWRAVERHDVTCGNAVEGESDRRRLVHAGIRFFASGEGRTPSGVAGVA